LTPFIALPGFNAFPIFIELINLIPEKPFKAVKKRHSQQNIDPVIPEKFLVTIIQSEEHSQLN